MGKDQELLDAARSGNVTVVEKILGQRAKRSGPLASLRRGPGANVQDASGYTALHHAALNGHRDVVKLLLQHEASPNVVDSKGSSPLHLAAWAGDAEIVRLILSQGPSNPKVNLATKDNETALHCAAQYGHTEVVSQLLQYGCDPCIRNSRGESALDLAAQYGRLETVELLVRTHPELISSLRCSSSSLIFPHTPLHLASRNGHRAVVEVLLAAGVDVNTRTSAGTAMHEAALCGKMEVVRTLLDRGVDLGIRDSRQNTVLDLLGQFPPHVTQDITAVIKRHRSSSGVESDADSENLPPIPVQCGDSLGSPYENVRPGDDLSPAEGTSPTQWQFYHKPRDDDRRVSGTSAASLGSDSGLYQTPPIPRGMLEGSFASEDLSLTLPPGYGGGRESDQLSVSSSSSVGGPSPRDRRCLPNDSNASGIYLPMAPLSSSSHTPASNSKVSPTPPKKPPRRNLSVSPTHLQTQMSLSADCTLGPSNYEYLFLARSGARSHIDLEQLQARREQLRHVTRSVDQYVDMKARYDLQILESGIEPVAITSIVENRPMKTQNPRRKLRRHCERAYENYDLDSSPTNTDKSPCSESGTPQDRTFVSNAFLTLKSSQESLLDYKRDGNDAQSLDNREATDKRLKRVQMMLPTSPTHYVQPPTPDHPPPSALQAEKSIHERIRPLSQVYKRRSRDMETETDEDLLQFPAGVSLDASSGSLSSVSLSDKSMSTDNVEEFFGDVPFAGLLKGSVSAERPRTLRRLRNVYAPLACGMGTGADSGSERLDDGEIPFRLTDRDRERDDKSLSIMSPFDEQEEWAKISEIMASFGTGLVRESVFVSELEKEFQTRLGLTSESTNSPVVSTTVGQWLSNLGLADYESLFVNYGFDDLEFINGVLDESDLRDMGITSDQERAAILNSVGLLQNRVEKRVTLYGQSVDDWLKGIHLESYADTFKKHLYTDMDRVQRVWEVELAAVLEIQKPAHRKRILASVSGPSTRMQMRNGNGANLEDLNKDLNTLKTNIQQLKEEIREKLPETPQNEGNVTISGGTSTTTAATVTTGTGTLRHRKNRPAPQPPQRPSSHNGAVSAPEQLEIRAPSELLFGVPSTLKTQWRHHPRDLVTGCVTYIANYLGSTMVKELRGTESTKKSIQKLKKTCRDPRVTPDITLAITYRGVRFLNTLTNEPICEHEIRNIHCACQDADDLTHFAYITKDHASRTHFCHVFCVPTMDQATEVILTLGQAFEVAYQIALREKLGNHAPRSQSANQLMNITITNNSTNNTTNLSTHNAINNELETNSNHNVINYNNSTNNSSSTINNSLKPKPRSKSITNPILVTSLIPVSSSNLNSTTTTTTGTAITTTINSNNHRERSPNSNSTSSTTSSSKTNSNATKLLASHGRSHSVNDIKINGNQLKLAPMPVDDIGIGVKDMKPGSRAPIALSEEL
ncbi:ankyrin repeat and sterile alpha motif domain-containing protein 1B-like isoform X2 [Leptopilina heterotoma]|uniref:ankyrin repeat and sterile alpha motif domain-containing protein 1B-like isoform X2 n=1 Tax=Leptopilina heterotoma TaxID=63436 RepID=UPI001CA964CB|nr:ankyrin repeat and sterile alpha motif domain-containing protein 1B-like isoform X2 [Leptopilina heterotoma]